ncbi:MAG: GntR family transcriptional regulator [Oscillospiraceae bacterium]|nr:GntR family transcriptional regulator [Oscillospiraceae bacterium]
MKQSEEKIYLRIARALEDDILSGLIREHEPVPSTHQYAEHYQVNPATAAKGVAILHKAGLLYKKRGLGLYVSQGARDSIQGERREEFRERFIVPMVEEAFKVGVSKRDLVAMIMAE